MNSIAGLIYSSIGWKVCLWDVCMGRRLYIYIICHNNTIRNVSMYVCTYTFTYKRGMAAVGQRNMKNS